MGMSHLKIKKVKVKCSPYNRLSLSLSLSVQDCDWPSYWTQHPEKTPLPARAGRQSAVQGVCSKRGNLGPHSL